MSGSSWTHLLARPMVRPLLGTWVRPNHLTTLRLATGVAACLLFALGTRRGMWWGGALWLLSAFLDRADGELAPILIGASVGATAMMLITAIRLLRLPDITRNSSPGQTTEAR